MHPVFSSTPVFERKFDDVEVRFFAPRANVLVTRFVGRLSREAADSLMQVGTPYLQRGSFVGLHDWTEMTSFEPIVPPLLVTWTLRYVMQIQRLVIATTNPLVSSAVRTTNLSIKRIEHMDSRDALEDAIRATLDTPSHPPR